MRWAAVVLETWGDSKQFDLVASRKLTLAARGVRRHVPVAADCRRSGLEYGRDALDHPLRAFAAIQALAIMGRAHARRATGSKSSRPERAMDHGMEV